MTPPSNNHRDPISRRLDSTDSAGPGEPAGPEELGTPHDELVQKVVVDPLKRRTAAPDLTDPIMRRLGYVRQDHRKARRAAGIRWSQRAALTAMALLAIYVATVVHSHLPQARKPSGPTLPAALQNDFRERQQQINQFINRIHQLAPRSGNGDLPVDADPPAPESSEESRPASSEPDTPGLPGVPGVPGNWKPIRVEDGPFRRT